MRGETIFTLCSGPDVDKLRGAVRGVMRRMVSLFQLVIRIPPPVARKQSGIFLPMRPRPVATDLPRLGKLRRGSGMAVFLVASRDTCLATAPKSRHQERIGYAPRGVGWGGAGGLNTRMHAGTHQLPVLASHGDSERPSVGHGPHREAMHIT